MYRCVAAEERGEIICLSRRSLEQRQRISAASSLGAGCRHEIARIQRRSRQIRCPDRMDDRHAVASRRVGHHSRLHTRASLGALQNPSLRARVEPGSTATDAHRSSRDRCGLGHEHRGSYMAPTCVQGRITTVESWLPTQACGVRTGATDWAGQRSAGTWLWRWEKVTDRPNLTPERRGDRRDGRSGEADRGRSTASRSSVVPVVVTRFRR